MVIDFQPMKLYRFPPQDVVKSLECRGGLDGEPFPEGERYLVREDLKIEKKLICDL